MSRNIAIILATAALGLGCSQGRTSGLNPPPGAGGGGGTTKVALTAADVTAAAQRNLAAVLTGVFEAQAITENNGVLGELGIELSDEAPCTGSGSTGPGNTGNGMAPPDPCGGDTAAERAAEMATDLVATYFNEADVESATDTVITYLVSAERICDGTPTTRVPPVGGGTGTGNQPEPALTDCEQNLVNSPVRVRVSARAAGNLDAELLIGPNTLRLMSAKIYPTRLDAELTLSSGKDHLDVIEDLFEMELPPSPSVLQGSLRLSISKSGDAYSAELAVPVAIRIAGTDDGQPYTIDIAAANPAISIDVDVAALRVESTTNLGEVSASLPMRLVYGGSDCAGSGDRRPGGGTGTGPGDGGGGGAPPPDPDPCFGENVSGTFGFVAKALVSTSVIDTRANTVSLDDLSTGNQPISATYNGTPLAALTIDVPVAAASVSGDDVALDLNRGLEIALRLTTARLASEVDVPDWSLDEELRATVMGGNASLLLLDNATARASDPPQGGGSNGGGSGAPIPEPPPTPEDALLRMVRGVLTLSAKTRPIVTVPAGSCLYGDFGDFASSGGSSTQPAGGDSGDSGSGGGGSGSGGSGTTPGGPPSVDGHPFGNLQSRPCN